MKIVDTKQTVVIGEELKTQRDLVATLCAVEKRYNQIITDGSAWNEFIHFQVNMLEILEGLNESPVLGVIDGGVDERT